MVHITRLSPSKFLSVKYKIALSYRAFSKRYSKDLTSKAIREKFLDYFLKEQDHKFVKSSPVVPYCDPTVAFVNAGMNQFKEIFLDEQPPPYRKVANTQKCVRVGGKHNDLSVVGTDGYHHTFFEMLGNWSFGDYFKREACELAWNLLIQVYNLPKSRLYVTFFKGDNDLGVEADLETKDIWRTLGVPESRILPFGVKDNFWEMGLVGPCGPCTEIHYDHIGGSDRAEFVNRGLHDLTEIWNIVFIQYNRINNESLYPLPVKHVDTGMGFERLTSVIQSKSSNYDTDNFSYLMKSISKNCSGMPQYEDSFGEKDWSHLDQSYRILADHSRMVTVCLADGMIPEENQKLRRVLRKALLLSETVFKKEKGLLKELSNYVIENLGPFYPELEKNVKQVHQIINYEEEVYKSLRKSVAKDWQKLTEEYPKFLHYDLVETPNLIAAFKEVLSLKPKKIDSKIAFKLYDAYGMDEENIVTISNILDVKFDPADLHKELEENKKRYRQSLIDDTCMINESNLSKTDDKLKYSYRKEGDSYVFQDLNIKVLAIYENNLPIKEIKSDHYCSILLDKTNLYSEAGGQISDKGTISFENGTFEVTSLSDVNGYIFHKGFYKSFDGHTLKTQSKGVLRVDESFRQDCMRNHTGVHLLNASLKKLKAVTCQKSSKVNDKYFNFDVALFGNKLTIDEVASVEKRVDAVIKNRRPVNVKEVNSLELLNLDCVTLIPGEVYPDKGIRIIEVVDDDFLSREPCCGTHVLNTGDLEDFSIISLKSLGRSTMSLYAVTGDRAKLAKTNGSELMHEIESLNIYINDNIDKPEMLEMAVSTLRKRLNFTVEDDNILPVIVKNSCVEKLDEMITKIKGRVKENLKDFIEIEMKNVLDSNLKVTKSNQKYVIHYLRTSTMLENVSLQKATRLCPDLPVLVIAYADNTVKARCCVPVNLKSNNFNAEVWLKNVAEVFRSKVGPPRGQDGAFVCNMKAKKVPVQEWDPLVKESLERAERFIEENL